MANRQRKAEEEYVFFDEVLFKRRNIIGQANAWLASFKALLILFETKAQHWLALHFLAFMVLLIRKINKNPLNSFLFKIILNNPCLVLGSNLALQHYLKSF